jgi:hypothetical protein
MAAKVGVFAGGDLIWQKSFGDDFEAIFKEAEAVAAEVTGDFPDVQVDVDVVMPYNTLVGMDADQT